MEEIIKNLEAAIKAHEEGLGLFPKKDYSAIPPDKEKEIMECCSRCAGHFRELRERLDLTYSAVYHFYRDGGIESDCRIGKNKWCFGLIEFAKARLKDLRRS
jgi:hypothetical protein